jgi:hypothetical protein
VIRGSMSGFCAIAVSHATQMAMRWPLPIQTCLRFCGDWDCGRQGIRCPFLRAGPQDAGTYFCGAVKNGASEALGSSGGRRLVGWVGVGGPHPNPPLIGVGDVIGPAEAVPL